MCVCIIIKLHVCFKMNLPLAFELSITYIISFVAGSFFIFFYLILAVYWVNNFLTYPYGFYKGLYHYI